jgi:hypothetical protein
MASKNYQSKKRRDAMLELLERQQTLTGNQRRIVFAAILADMLEFFGIETKGRSIEHINDELALPLETRQAVAI